MVSTATGKTIGPYEVLAPLGSGGMGDVYRAWDYRLQREVALKVVNNSGGDPEWQQRFLREARAIAALNHPNILTVHDVGIDSGTPYMVVELVEGDTLRAVLKRGALLLDKALDIAVQILDGLVVAHASGIVHRDLKPANIMVSKTGLVKVLDFGLAKRTEAESRALEGGEGSHRARLNPRHRYLYESRAGAGRNRRHPLRSVFVWIDSS